LRPILKPWRFALDRVYHDIGYLYILINDIIFLYIIIEVSK
jgi:hypothetical protein